METRGLISDVPIGLSDQEIFEALEKSRVTFVRRRPYRSAKGLSKSTSVLLYFASPIPPTVVEIGFLRFRTRVYNVPTTRRFNCNRFGHTAWA